MQNKYKFLENIANMVDIKLKEKITINFLLFALYKKPIPGTIIDNNDAKYGFLFTDMLNINNTLIY